MEQEEKFSQGKWIVGCLCNHKETSCECSYILNEGYFGSICTVNWSKDSSLQEGNNPLREEAIANSHLIAVSPKMYYLLKEIANYKESSNGLTLDDYSNKAIELCKEARGDYYAE